MRNTRAIHVYCEAASTCHFHLPSIPCILELHGQLYFPTLSAAPGTPGYGNRPYDKPGLSTTFHYTCTMTLSLSLSFMFRSLSLYIYIYISLSLPLSPPIKLN